VRLFKERWRSATFSEDDWRMSRIIVDIVNSHLKDWLAAVSGHRDKAIVCSMSWQPLLVAWAAQSDCF
jgi:hypothetical protein